MSADAASRPPDPDVSTAIFLVGLFGLLLSAAGFIVALGIGVDVRLPLLTNAASAIVILTWLAADRLGDPTSGVGSLPGAVGTVLLSLGAYGLLIAVVVAATARWHGQFDHVWFLVGGAVVAGVLGAITFPLEVVTGSVNRSEED